MPSSDMRELTDLRKLAEARFGSLSVSEIELLLSALKGEIAYCGPSKENADPDNDPMQSDRWALPRHIRSELIRWLCSDREARNCVDPRGLQAHAAKITGPLDLSFVSVPFFLRLAHCHFSDDVNLRFTEIPAIDLTRSLLPCLYASYASVKGTMSLQGLHASGVVRLYGARIDGNLECNGGKFRNPWKAGDSKSGTALHAEGAKVCGHIFLGEGFVAEGEVRLFGAQIGGNLECGEGKFQNLPQNGVTGSGVALNAEHAKIGGGVHLRNEFVSEGEVRFFGAEIGGNLDCDGGEFRVESQEGVESIALNVEYAKVTGSAYLRRGFCAKGKVRLYHAQIGRNLECKSARVESLELTNASAAAILDEKASWPSKLLLDGFTYGRISGDEEKTEERLEWLARHKSFSRHPYRQFAKVLRDTGDDQGARRVCAEMERRAWAQRGWLFQPVSYLLRATIGYGYFSLRALRWLLGLFALGWVVYYQGYVAGSMVPTDKEAYARLVVDNKVPGYYQTFHAAAYSLENSFPLLKLGVQDKWGPGPCVQGVGRSRDWWTSPGFLLWFRWGQICVGWLLATLFVGGVTGIIRTE